MKKLDPNELEVHSLILSDDDLKKAGEVLAKFRIGKINAEMSSAELLEALSKINVTAEEVLIAFKASLLYPIFILNGNPFILFLHNLMPKKITYFISWLGTKISRDIESKNFACVKLLREVIRTNHNGDTLLLKAHQQNCELRVMSFLIDCGRYSPADIEKILFHNIPIAIEAHPTRKRGLPEEVKGKSKKTERAKKAKTSRRSPAPPITLESLRTGWDYSKEEKIAKKILDAEMNSGAKNTLKVLTQCQDAGILGRLSESELEAAFDETTFTVKEFFLACKLSTFSPDFKYKKRPFIGLLFTFAITSNAKAFTRWFDNKVTAADLENPVFKFLIKDVLRTSAHGLFLIQKAYIHSARAMQRFIIKYAEYSDDELCLLTRGRFNKRGNKILVVNKTASRKKANLHEESSSHSVNWPISTPTAPVLLLSPISNLLRWLVLFLSQRNYQVPKPHPELSKSPASQSPERATPPTSLALHPNSLFRPLPKPTPTGSTSSKVASGDNSQCALLSHG